MIVTDENRVEARAGAPHVKKGRQPRPRGYRKPYYRFLKRTFDILVSFIALVVLLPVFLVIAILIAATEGLPVLFKQKRVGKAGKLFDIYKFRTMVRDADKVLQRDPELWAEFQKTYKLEKDPRISKLGHFLRKSTLDELPQLFNVLKGEMSLVGPRPIVEPELDKYGEHQSIYLSMKPGCAGLWQCSGRSSTTYDERVALDTEYYDKAGFRYDFRILFRTLGTVFTGHGAQ